MTQPLENYTGDEASTTGVAVFLVPKGCPKWSLECKECLNKGEAWCFAEKGINQRGSPLGLRLAPPKP